MKGAEDDLADLAGHGVEYQEEEDGDECQHQQEQQDVPAPAQDEEDESLQWVYEPVKRGFGAAVGRRAESGSSADPPTVLGSVPLGPTHLGFSRGSGSFRPLPTGCFSASSTVNSSNSASTFP